MNSTGALLVGLPTFAGLSEEDRETIGARCGRRAIRAGETLIAEGAPSDTLHLVLFGRFDVMKAGQSAPLAAIGAGEPVGEIGFFAGLPRTATVIARRDSEVLTLAREDYAALVQQVPGLASTVLASLAGRLADATARAAPPESEPGRIVLLCGAGDAPVPAGFGAELAASLAPHADAVWIDRETCQRASGSDAPDGPEALHWLRRQEAAHRLVLLEVGREADRWTALAARHADALLLVSGEGEATARSPAERAVLEAIPPSARRLALLPEAGAASLPWIEGRDPAAHHFLTPPGGMKRLARFLAGTARGLVLGGGGALCGAHIGTVFALMDAGCRFEAFGGSSAGGAVAAAFAAEVPRAEMVAVVKDIFLTAGSFRKWTVPRHGLIDAGEFDARLRTHYGTRPIEDLPHPWFAMASDLSTNGPRRIETGPFWEAVRATCSIPALLPPFIDGEGRVLVDGGIVDNLPVGPMRARKHGPNLAVALALPDARPVRGRYADFPTRGRLLAETVLPFLRQRRGVPRLAPTLTRTMLLSSNARVHEAMAQADLALLPPSPKGMGILDWHRFEAHEREAYDWASAWIEAQPEAALALFTGE